MCILFTVVGTLSARTVYHRQDGNRELDLELGSYYTTLDYYLPLTEAGIPCSNEQDELKIYRALLLSPRPRFIVLELSVNPMPCLGVFIRRNLTRLYWRADINRDFNLIRAATAGFEEPYAASVFLGNVISYRPRSATDCEGKGYAGFLLSGGNYHIKDNELIDDRWLEGELKIKGDRRVPAGKMAWSCRIGVKHHGNACIRDVLYFAVRRDRMDINRYDWSLLTNSGFDYRIDVDKDSGRPLRHYFRVGKKLPLRNSRKAVSLYIGLLWEDSGKYTGVLKRAEKDSNFQFLLQPYMEF